MSPRRNTIDEGTSEEIPQFIGGYTITARLSAHKATSVFRAYDATNHRDVCIKQLTVVGSNSKSSVAAMGREVEFSRRLRHDGLPEIYAYNTSQPRHFFVMEYFAPGATLQAVHLSNNPPFTPPLLRPLLFQVLETLAFIHSQGVVHRDIKPDNILVNERGLVKLIDLSVGFDMKDRLPAWKRMLGMKHKVVGTRTYMPPEQIEGLDVDPRADLYAFGVMLYELLAGRPPFVGDKPDDVLMMHLKDPPPSLIKVAPDVTPETNQLVARLMAKDPTKRPASAQEVLDHLQKHRLRVKKDREPDSMEVRPNRRNLTS
jgi:serine/threonine protein kinase